MPDDQAPLSSQPSAEPAAAPDPGPAKSSLWYAIQVNSKCESQVHRDLVQRDFEAFLPVHRVRRRWSDRVKYLDAPLFPGYLFGRFDLQDRFRILNLPGVARLVGAGTTPLPVSEGEIHSIKILVTSKVALVPWPYLHTGQRVLIDQGPLAGVEGIVTQAESGKSRIVVSVSLLQRSVAAQIERDWITRVLS